MHRERELRFLRHGISLLCGCWSQGWPGAQHEAAGQTCQNTPLPL